MTAGRCSSATRRPGRWRHYGAGRCHMSSPCGTVLDRNAADLVTEPARRYPHLRGIEPPVVEGLLVPVSRQHAPIGTVWVIAHWRGKRFDAEDVRLVTVLCQFASGAVRDRRTDPPLRPGALVDHRLRFTRLIWTAASRSSTSRCWTCGDRRSRRSGRISSTCGIPTTWRRTCSVRSRR